jgi:penicillin-binding protein activator
MMIKRFLFVGGLVCAVGLTSACGSRQFTKGQYDEDVNEANLLTDKWSESDMQTAVRELVASATSHPAIAGSKRPPIVMVTRLQNKTS